MLKINDRRECFFDDYLIDTDRTTAEFRIHEPVRRECVLCHDEPWEGDGCNYHNTFYDDEWNGGVRRMYYLCRQCFSSYGIRVCYAESRDGLHWVKPKLGICEFGGSMENNIILDKTTLAKIDNFMVFRDDNPACQPEKHYKAIVRVNINPKYRTLWYFYSADGLTTTDCAFICSRDGARFKRCDEAFMRPGAENGETGYTATAIPCGE